MTRASGAARRRRKRAREWFSPYADFVAIRHGLSERNVKAVENAAPSRSSALDDIARILEIPREYLDSAAPPVTGRTE